MERAALFGLGLLALLPFAMVTIKKKQKPRLAKLIEIQDDLIGKNEYKDEFIIPNEVKKILYESKLCYLSCQNETSPHMSLMHLTYLGNDIIVISTRKNTKKYKLIQKNPEVSVLIHDFPSYQNQVIDESKGSGNTLSIGIIGIAVIQYGEKEQYYRELHLANNIQSKQFILGPDIAIITIRILHLRMCNIQDQVTTWESEAFKKAQLESDGVSFSGFSISDRMSNI